MKINELSLQRLKNEEHFQFHADFKGLVLTFNPATLKVDAAFAAYLPIFSNESDALDVIRKSMLTNDIAEADDLRDSTYIGLSDAIKSAGRHFRPEVQQAASRLQVIIGNHSNLIRKSYDEETAAINSLINDFNTIGAADLAIIGIADWVNELQANNNAFDDLKKGRYTEEAGKTQLQMKEVRLQLDEAYHAIVNRINALILVNGETAYINFVNELNQRVESYSKLVAQRRGRNAKNPPLENPITE